MLLFARGFLVVLDFILISLSFLFASFIRFGFALGLKYFLIHFSSIFLVDIIYLVIFFFFDLYFLPKDYRKFRHLVYVFAAVYVAFLMHIFVFFIQESLTMGKGIMLFQTLMVVSGVFLIRCIFSIYVVRGRFNQRTLIIGIGESAKETCLLIENHKEFGLNVVGFISDGPLLHKQEKFVHPKEFQKIKIGEGFIPIVGEILNFKKIVHQQKAQVIILAANSLGQGYYFKDLLDLRLEGIALLPMPTMFERIAREIPFRHVNFQWLLDTCIYQSKFATMKFKRLFDIIVSIALLILLLPILLLAIGIMKLIEPRSPVFYTQERLGKFSVPFQIIKLRTMVIDAEKQSGPVWAKEKDPRVTRVGHVLRKLRIDEIPQLFNVFKGEMSIVGPRPERQIFIKGFKKSIPFYHLRLAVQPGITGWAQVRYPYAASIRATEEKFRCDLYYIKNMSMVLDINILWNTVQTVITGRGL